MKILVGRVFVACWSMADGDEHGLREQKDGNEELDWEKVRLMPSARLFFLQPGDVLVMPCGTYHYVYTVQKKIVVAGDFLNDSCWPRREKSEAFDHELGSAGGMSLAEIRKNYYAAAQRAPARSASRASHTSDDTTTKSDCARRGVV